MWWKWARGGEIGIRSDRGESSTMHQPTPVIETQEMHQQTLDIMTQEMHQQGPDIETQTVPETHHSEDFQDEDDGCDLSDMDHVLKTINDLRCLNYTNQQIISTLGLTKSQLQKCLAFKPLPVDSQRIKVVLFTFILHVFYNLMLNNIFLCERIYMWRVKMFHIMMFKNQEQFLKIMVWKMKKLMQLRKISKVRKMRNRVWKTHK